MNESGRSVAPAMRFYKLPPERLVVVHDEIDLPLGDIRAKAGGGLAGHNGLRSVRRRDRHAGLPARADRHRPAGAGRPAAGGRLGAAAVRARDATSTTLVQRGADCALAVVRDGIDAAMRRVQLATGGGAMITAGSFPLVKTQKAEIDAYTLSAS